MVQVDVRPKRISMTLLVCGPAGSGKSTLLRMLNGGADVPDGEAVTMDLPPLRGFRIHVQVMEAPTQKAARITVLPRADGIVFVADSRKTAQPANLVAVEELSAVPAAVPRVFLYNKRDLPDEELLTEDALRAALNARPHGVDSLQDGGLVATTGVGMTGPVQQLIRRVLTEIRKPA